MPSPSPPRHHGDTTLIVLGLIISIPLIIFGATLIMVLLNRFPIIVIAGGADRLDRGRGVGDRPGLCRKARRHDPARPSR